jgi:hypothetical protein
LDARVSPHLSLSPRTLPATYSSPSPFPPCPSHAGAFGFSTAMLDDRAYQTPVMPPLIQGVRLATTRLWTDPPQFRRRCVEPETRPLQQACVLTR